MTAKHKADEEIDLEKKYQKRNVELQQMIIKLRAEIEALKAYGSVCKTQIKRNGK